jgi:hypothetical protein
MKHLPLFLLLNVALLGPAAALAQTSNPSTEAAGNDLQSNDRFVMQGGAVMKQRGKQTYGLSQNVRLPNGTKINVKSGIVELGAGRIITLKEGDYVNAEGGVVYATPQNAAAARGETAPPDASFNYVDRSAPPSTVADMDARLGDMGRRLDLMAQKIQLLNQKISLLSQNNPKANTSQLDKQIKALDEQLRATK